MLIFQLVMLIFGGVSEVMKIMVGWKGGLQVGEKGASEGLHRIEDVTAWF